MLCPDYNSHLAFPNKLQFVVSNYVYCSIGWRNGHNIKYLLNFLALYRFSIHVLTLTCGQLCVMIEERLWIQAGEMNFLWLEACHFLRFSHSGERQCRVELLLYFERTQLRWLGELTRMPPGHLLREVWSCHTGIRPWGRHRTHITPLAREHLCVPTGELGELAGEKEV